MVGEAEGISWKGGWSVAGTGARHEGAGGQGEGRHRQNKKGDLLIHCSATATRAYVRRQGLGWLGLLLFSKLHVALWPGSIRYRDELQSCSQSSICWPCTLHVSLSACGKPPPCASHLLVADAPP